MRGGNLWAPHTITRSLDFDELVRDYPPSQEYAKGIFLHEYYSEAGARPTPSQQFARDHVDAVLVPNPADPHTALADRVLEVLDQIGGIEGVRVRPTHADIPLQGS